MNRTVVAVGAVVVGLVIIVGVAFAFSGGGGSDKAAQSPTPTLTPGVTLTPSATAVTPTTTASPVPTASPTVGTSAPGTVIVPPPASPPSGVTAIVPPPASPPVPPTPTLEAGRKAVPAPIDKLEVQVLESFPAQYLVHVQAGLPDGCARQYASSVERNGDVITIAVLNSAPTQIVACTQIYGNYELNFNLGSQFQSGTTYTVKVNDKTTTFTAQ